MKGKKVFLISSLLAALGLVGGTFAAWAVTDNADPFSVKITPGTLDIGGDKSVTLDWGTKGLVDIEQITIGEEKGPYEVGLIATTSDASGFTGSLTVSMVSQENTAKKLIDYLHVNVYANSTKTGDPLLTVPDGELNYTASVDIAVTSGTEKKVYFFIQLESGINPTDYEIMKNNVVTLNVDWNKGSAIDVVTSSTYYFNNSSSWANVYAYAWSSADGSMNAAWPGVKMTQEKGAIYSVAIPTAYDKVIFNDGVGGEGKQTVDLTLPAVSAQTPYWNGTAWAAKPDISAETVYYLVGTFNSWTTGSAYQLTAESSTKGTFAYTHKILNVDVPADSYLKIVGSDNIWYGQYGATDPDNFHIGDANHYNFYFNFEGSNNIYIYCEVVA